TPTGRIRWQAPATAGIGTAQLQIGPDRRLYAAQACGGSCAPFGGHTSWTPLTTRPGRPLSLHDRRSEASPFEPLSGGLRLVSQLSYSVHGSPSSTALTGSCAPGRSPAVPASEPCRRHPHSWTATSSSHSKSRRAPATSSR